MNFILLRMKSIYDAEYRRIIDRLIAIRKARGVRQSDLAERLGVPQPFISKVETFVRRLDLIETIRICDALGISINDLLDSATLPSKNDQ